MNDQLRKFMSAYKFWWKVLSVSMIALCVIFVISAIAGNNVQYGGLVVFLVVLGLSFLPQYKSKKFYTDMKTRGVLLQVEADFDRAISVLKNNVRLGNNWIFVKGKERLLDYEDITQIYQYIHKTNFVENERAIKYVDKKGKHRVLCKLALRGKSDEEVLKIIGIILSKNPNVKIGYR